MRQAMPRLTHHARSFDLEKESVSILECDCPHNLIARRERLRRKRRVRYLAAKSVTWTPSTQATTSSTIRNQECLSSQWVLVSKHQGIARMQVITTRSTSNQAEKEKHEDFEVDWVLLYDFEHLGK